MAPTIPIATALVVVVLMARLPPVELSGARSIVMPPEE
jgi:hypothetical protein